GADSECAQLVGPVAKVDPGILQVGGTTVRSDSHPTVSVGDEVRVVGRWDGSAVVAYSVEAIPRVPFDGRVPRVEIEGYAWHGATGQLQVGGYSVEVSPSATLGGQGPPTANTPVRIQAVVRDRRVIVERIRVINEAPSLHQAPQMNPRGWNG